MEVESNASKADQENRAEEIRVNMVARIQQLTAQITPTVANVHKLSEEDHTKAVQVLRARIELLRKEISKATTTFDATLRNAQSGFAGEDFLKGVETFRKESDKVGRPKKVRPEVPEELTTW